MKKLRSGGVWCAVVILIAGAVRSAEAADPCGRPDSMTLVVTSAGGVNGSGGLVTIAGRLTFTITNPIPGYTMCDARISWDSWFAGPLFGPGGSGTNLLWPWDFLPNTGINCGNDCGLGGHRNPDTAYCDPTNYVWDFELTMPTDWPDGAGTPTVDEDLDAGLHSYLLIPSLWMICPITVDQVTWWEAPFNNGTVWIWDGTNKPLWSFLEVDPTPGTVIVFR